MNRSLYRRIAVARSIALAIVGYAVVFLRVTDASSPASQPSDALHPPFKKVWEFESTSCTASHFLAGNTLFISGSRTYARVDLNSAKALWDRTIPSNPSSSKIAYDGKVLCVAASETALLVCDPQTGAKLWSMPLKGFASPITISRGQLYCELRPGVLTALDIATRKTLWTRQVDTTQKVKSEKIGWSVAPVVQDARVLVATVSGQVISMERRSGSVLWRRSIAKPDGDSWIRGLAADSRRLYLATWDGEVMALDLRQGRPLWHFETGGSLEGLTVAGNLVLLGSSDGLLYAVNAADGRKRWSATVTREMHPTLMPPDVKDGQILLTSGTHVFAYDMAGKQLWKWDTEQDMEYLTFVLVLHNEMVIVGQESILKFAMGEPPSLPTLPAERRALAEQLVARFDNLSDDEKRKLRKLGDEAFSALLPVVKERLEAFEEEDKRNQDKSYPAYHKFSEVFDALSDVTTEKHTGDLMALFEGARTDDGRAAILRVLSYRGDEKQTIPLLLDILEADKPYKESGSPWCSYITMAVMRSRHPEAVKFLMDRLADPSAEPELRRAAFTSLPCTAGQEGVNAVLAVKDRRRGIPSIPEIMNLDKLPAGVPKRKPDEYVWTWSHSAELLKTRKDKNGVLWGLLKSRVVGCHDDLWIAHHDGNHWVKPLFTGMTLKQLGTRDWFAKFVGNASLSRDSDSDGWTDLMERRLGTHPWKADTDGDGLRDSRDKNPLAAFRKLSDAEKVFAAAFEARFIFGGGRIAPCAVGLPKGIEPFELPGWEWVTICQPRYSTVGLVSFAGEGTSQVEFLPPSCDSTGDAVHTRDRNASILWSSDRTEAKVQVATGYGGADGTGFDVHLKKFGERWVVVSMEMAWIS